MARRKREPQDDQREPAIDDATAQRRRGSALQRTILSSADAALITINPFPTDDQVAELKARQLTPAHKRYWKRRGDDYIGAREALVEELGLTDAYKAFLSGGRR